MSRDVRACATATATSTPGNASTPGRRLRATYVAQPRSASHLRQESGPQESACPTRLRPNGRNPAARAIPQRWPVAGSHAAQRNPPKEKGLSREGQERRLVNKDRVDASACPSPRLPRLGFDSALLEPAFLPVVFSPAPSSSSSGEGIAALAPGLRTSPAPPRLVSPCPRLGTWYQPPHPCSYSRSACQILVCCFASSRRRDWFCRCCRDRECACAFGFTALGRFSGRVLLGDDALTG